MKRVPVESAVLKSIGYDQENRILHVQFPSGDVYEYTDFQLADWNRLDEAVSKGSWFSKNIRGKFPSRKVEERKPETDDYSSVLEKSVNYTDPSTVENS